MGEPEGPVSPTEAGRAGGRGYWPTDYGRALIAREAVDGTAAGGAWLVDKLCAALPVSVYGYQRHRRLPTSERARVAVIGGGRASPVLAIANVQLVNDGMRPALALRERELRERRGAQHARIGRGFACAEGALLLRAAWQAAYTVHPTAAQRAASDGCAREPSAVAPLECRARRSRA